MLDRISIVTNSTTDSTTTAHTHIHTEIAANCNCPLPPQFIHLYISRKPTTTTATPASVLEKLVSITAAAAASLRSDQVEAAAYYHCNSQ